MVQALRYEPESRGFDFRRMALGSTQASNKNEYQEFFLWGIGYRGVQLTALALSYADCLEVWEPQPAGILKGLSRRLLGLKRESV